jgi:hypothetical protein
MVTTIASLHLLAVLAVAILTMSKALTWIAAGLTLWVAFAIGGSAYGLIDALSAMIGLGIGLSMIGGRDRKALAMHRPDAAQQVVMRAPPDRDSGKAKVFELHQRKKSYSGRWSIAIVFVAVALWWTWK